MILMSLLFVGVLSYLVEINSLSIFTFKMDALKQRITELEGNNQNTELQLNKSESLVGLEQWASQSGLVAIKQFDYLKFTDGVVAVK